MGYQQWFLCEGVHRQQGAYVHTTGTITLLCVVVVEQTLQHHENCHCDVLSLYTVLTRY